MPSSFSFSAFFLCLDEERSLRLALILLNKVVDFCEVMLVPDLEQMVVSLNGTVRSISFFFIIALLLVNAFEDVFRSVIRSR